jgi:hypothetical protein
MGTIKQVSLSFILTAFDEDNNAVFAISTHVLNKDGSAAVTDKTRVLYKDNIAVFSDNNARV